MYPIHPSLTRHSDSLDVQVMPERVLLTSENSLLFAQTSGVRWEARWQIWRGVHQIFECLHTLMTHGRKYKTECKIIVEASASCSDKDKKNVSTTVSETEQKSILCKELQFHAFILTVVSLYSNHCWITFCLLTMRGVKQILDRKTERNSCLFNHSCLRS